ncbi:recombinase family protein [Phycisphaerales bacterium AB-hyl4]|uniref:Recombinase family protein n=1 Tax=Natronomicrosphaera hydrolytica TaxID=3242702 RepID=A0ABV4U6Y1_9BACT
MTRPVRVALYARVSTDGQSVDPQLACLREHCRSRGWEPVEFIDEGISGTRDSRPGWNACWDALNKGQLRILVVYALDRLGRSLPHLVQIIEFMTARNLVLVSYRENIDLASSTGRMLAGIFSVLAEYERSIISERTKAGLRNAKAKGKRVGNAKRYFDKGKATQLRQAGWGQVRIAKTLGVGVGRVNQWVRQEYNRDHATEGS